MSEIKRNGHGAMDMTQGSPTRLIVLFSLPLLAGNVLQQLYNMVDSVVVATATSAWAPTGRRRTSRPSPNTARRWWCWTSERPPPWTR